MPKRVNNFFKEKIKFQNMLNAFKRAAKRKNENKEVILFKMNLANNLTNILKKIYTKTYKPGIYRRFVVYEPKERTIMALPFEDRVVHQWYVEEFIKPIFVPKFIQDTYACIPGRGVHEASKKLKYYMIKYYKKNRNFYILKCDISKYFNSIDKNILFNIITRYVKDKDFLDFTKTILFDGTGKKGIPIGNYTSQFYANIYLNELDHYIKEVLHIKYYIRYMDDFVLLLKNKEYSKETLGKITKFLEEKLQLKLNKKTNYFKCKQGVNFCGYRIFLNKVLLRTDNKRKIYKKIKNWNKVYYKNKLDLFKTYESFQSWMAHASHCDSEDLIAKAKKKCEWLYDEEKEYIEK